MGAQVITVVGKQHDDGVVAKPRRIQRVQQPADLGIHESDGGVVTLNRRDLLFVGHRQLTQTVRQGGDGNVGPVLGRVRRRIDRLRRIHLEVGGRGDVGRVRTKVAHRQEQRLARLPRIMRLEQVDGGVRDPSIGMLRLVAGDAQPGQCPAGPCSWSDRVDVGIVVHVDAPRIAPLVPGLQVIVPVGADVPGNVVVENLAHPRCEVSIACEVFRQRNHIGNEFSKALAILEDAGLLRIQAGQETGPAGGTHRKLGIGGIEPQALGRQSVDGWRPDQWMAIGSQIGVEVVQRDEQDVRSLLCHRRAGHHQQAHCNTRRTSQESNQVQRRSPLRRRSDQHHAAQSQLQLDRRRVRVAM